MKPEQCGAVLEVTIKSPNDNKTSQISRQLKVPTENNKSPNNKTVSNKSKGKRQISQQ